MKKWWKHISEWELHKIEAFLWEWYSIPKVAKKLWRSKNTVYEIFKNNWVDYGKERKSYWPWWCITWRWKWKKKIYFTAQTIHNKRVKRKGEASKRYCRIEPWWKLEWYILAKIQEYLSPEQISWRWKRDHREKLSKDTIYSYIYSTHSELIKKYFRLFSS